MRKVALADTDLQVSRFIFGTAGLFNAGGLKRRLELLESAFDQGVTHFDTAPYYGFGAAERAMKPFLARHPEATVTTKVGIYSPGGERQPDGLVFLRKAAGRVIPAISRPTIDWSLTMRMGSYAEPAGKEGLGALTAAMVRRGPKGKTFDQFNEELESRGISLDASDGGDNTAISGNCLTEQFGTAMAATRAMLLQPAFDAEEFARLKAQLLADEVKLISLRVFKSLRVATEVSARIHHRRAEPGSKELRRLVIVIGDGVLVPVKTMHK